ncbi:MAG: FAD-dependent oxidoreductase [Candidatus Doudnabacteria bacterium]|nr:FAD-dependent oxidoreductase [Candidatus Doudnabacteria bacterium]
MTDVIIVGGGVAAYTSALFAARRGLQVLVLAKDIGGQANSTDEIQNYPGFTAVGGYELVSKMKKQAETWGVSTEIVEVSKLKQTSDGLILQAFGKQYKSQTVILAFGKSPMDLNVAGETELKGKGISYCATCDAPLYKGKTVIIAGYGDFGLEAAILCAKYAKKVYTLSKTDKLIGHPGLVKKVLKNKKIELTPFAQIQEICGTKHIEYLKCLDLKSGKQIKMLCEGLFVEIGYVVNSGWLQDVIELDEQGQIVIAPDQSTSMEGVFAAGDATNRPYKQAVISAGEGAAAALAAHDYIMKGRGGAGMTSDWTQIKKI